MINPLEETLRFYRQLHDEDTLRGQQRKKEFSKTLTSRSDMTDNQKKFFSGFFPLIHESIITSYKDYTIEQAIGQLLKTQSTHTDATPDATSRSSHAVRS